MSQVKMNLKDLLSNLLNLPFHQDITIDVPTPTIGEIVKKMQPKDLENLCLAMADRIWDLQFPGGNTRDACASALSCAIYNFRDWHNKIGAHSLTMDEINALRYESKIAMIKLIRARLNLGLKEAKDVMDAFCAKYGDKAERYEAPF